MRVFCCWARVLKFTTSVSGLVRLGTRTAGAGAKGGTLYGQSDPHAAYPVTDPVSPQDLATTIYMSRGIDSSLRIPNALGQPLLLVQNGQPLDALFTGNTSVHI